MNLSEKILREYVEFDDINGDKTVELLPLTIADAMIEYNELKSSEFTCEYYYNDINVYGKTFKLDIHGIMSAAHEIKLWEKQNKLNKRYYVKIK